MNRWNFPYLFVDYFCVGIRKLFDAFSMDVVLHNTHFDSMSTLEMVDIYPMHALQQYAAISLEAFLIKLNEFDSID